MTIFEIIVLAIIQGLTEFLPISSSAHLILPAELFGWREQGLAFDVAVHVGSLIAVMLYLRKDIKSLTIGWFASVSGKANDDGRLAWLIVLATIPVVIVGFLMKDLIEVYARSGWVIVATTIIFALLLWWADQSAKQQHDLQKLTWRSALLIGLSQIAALIPGTSRSGVTMTTALFLGLDRVSAARFSFLLSIPTILGAGLLETRDLLASPEAINWTELMLGLGLSFISAYICIALFINWISRIGMGPFVIYRLLLAAVMIWILW
ncbi:MAG: undecaprenyl-diphosphate phosphatase [Aestuariibacter sp.]